MNASSRIAVEGVLETCLYADDLASAEQFYREVIGLVVHARMPGRHVFFRCGPAMFLVFNPTATGTGLDVGPGERRLQHGAVGPGHVAFQVDESALAAWRDTLASQGVPIEAEVSWPKGGHSIYVRDPAGNSVELATRALWAP